MGFTNISAQMSSMMSQCAVLMFDQGRVKVIVQGLTWYDLGPLPSLITLTTILNKLPPFPMLQRMRYSPLFFDSSSL